MNQRTGLARGGRVVADTVRFLLTRDGNRCRRCSRPIDMWRSGLDPDGPTIGHIIPAAAGGTDARENLALEHRRCNLAAGAGDRPPAAALPPALIARPVSIEFRVLPRILPRPSPADIGVAGLIAYVAIVAWFAAR